MTTNKIVLGAGFGDEGKGRVVSSLVANNSNSLVVRFNGGHQAGHTVVKDNISHVFSSFGSGSLHGVSTYWSKNCTVYPFALLNEYKCLQEKGITPELFIHPLAPITTILDVRHNRSTAVHGTVGVGFGATIQRQEDHYKLHFIDLLYTRVLKEKLVNIAKYYKISKIEEFIEKFQKNVSLLANIPTIHMVEAPDWNAYSNIVYEGAQGILLDKDYGFFPFVTRSNTTSQNAFAMLNSSATVFYVTRCYQVRHGLGPMTNEKIPPPLINNANETNKTNDYQGSLRIGALDVDLLHYSLKVDEIFSRQSFKCLVVTCLDQISGDFSVTKSGKIYNFTDSDHLIKSLKTWLKVDEVLISNSPTGELLRSTDLKVNNIL